jgi:hypothetical protein
MAGKFAEPHLDAEANGNHVCAARVCAAHVCAAKTGTGRGNLIARVACLI